MIPHLILFQLLIRRTKAEKNLLGKGQTSPVFGAEPLLPVGEELNNGERDLSSLPVVVLVLVIARDWDPRRLYISSLTRSAPVSSLASDRLASHKSNCSYGQSNCLEGACFILCLHFGKASFYLMRW